MPILHNTNPLTQRIKERQYQTFRWKYQSSLSPWFLAMYPINTIQIRSSCSQWLKLAGSSLPEWFPEELKGDLTAKPILINTLQSTSSLINQTTKDPIKPSSFLSNNVLVGSLTSAKTVYQKEGIYGLYRGVGVTFAYACLRDVSLFCCMQLFHSPLQQWFHWVRNTVYGPLPVDKDKGQTLICYNSDNQIMKNQCDERSKLPKSFGVIAPVIDFAHLCIKACVEIALYPLVTMKHRLIVHEGPERIGFLQMMDLSYKFDGLWHGFFQGMPTHLSIRCAEDIADIASLKLCRCYNIEWSQALVVRTGVSSILSTLTAPMVTYALIRNVQSNIPGLCNKDVSSKEILASIPWKLYAFNFLITSALTSFSIAVVFKTAVSNRLITWNDNSTSSDDEDDDCLALYH